jgi:uncharacterized membrane protein
MYEITNRRLQMTTFLWILQILLALVFLLTGVRKFTRSDEQTRALPWAKGLEPNQVRGIGVLEVLAAAGLILPWATHILPWLTPLAAVGIVLLLLGAAYANYRARLMPPLMVNAILAVLAAVVVYGRFAMAG